MSFGPNSKLYRELLSTPFASADVAAEAMNAFFSEVGKLREKYRIANVYIIVEHPTIEGDGEFEASQTCSFGDVLRREPMTARAFAAEQANRDTIIRQCLKKPKSLES